MENQKQSKTTVADVIESAAPKVKSLAVKASSAALIISEKMEVAGGVVSEKLKDRDPGLTNIIIVQAVYSLTLAIVSAAVGENSLFSVIVGQLPLAVYGISKIILRVKK